MVKLNKILQNNDQDRKGKVINNRYRICEIQIDVNIKKSINKPSWNKSQNKENKNFSNLLKTLLKTLINKPTEVVETKELKINNSLNIKKIK